jgi:hypothetical protein
VPGFDIRTILQFQPPKFLCEACRGLFEKLESVEGSDPWDDRQCPVCKCTYVKGEYAGESYGAYKGAYKYLKEQRLNIEHGDSLLSHATALARLVQKSEGRGRWEPPWPTMRLLFETLTRARHFVHFASWGISHLMIGALKITSMRVPVYGFVSDVEGHARAELTEFPLEAPNLHAHVVPTRAGTWDAPHQKLVVVDGLLAFKGSANLTNNGMRKADRGLDVSEVVTDFEEVKKINNKYFSPVWKQLTMPDATEVRMFDDVPF